MTKYKIPPPFHDRLPFAVELSVHCKLHPHACLRCGWPYPKLSGKSDSSDTQKTNFIEMRNSNSFIEEIQNDFSIQFLKGCHCCHFLSAHHYNTMLYA